ncbi:helix-turn-helix transcriptional regulator [Chitinophaga sp. 22536]|uniref:helix-turn-helix transcriptional regulator n=1 Tax=unclassified Chitinophaga TaxID=2619133 RepID=UPI003F845A98
MQYVPGRFIATCYAGQREQRVPAGYIHHLRMEKARKLLLEGEQVSTVAYLLGYNTPNNFSIAFRKRFGISPGKFKR